MGIEVYLIGLVLLENFTFESWYGHSVCIFEGIKLVYTMHVYAVS